MESSGAVPNEISEHWNLRSTYFVLFGILTNFRERFAFTLAFFLNQFLVGEADGGRDCLVDQFVKRRTPDLQMCVCVCMCKSHISVPVSPTLFSMYSASESRGPRWRGENCRCNEDVATVQKKQNRCFLSTKRAIDFLSATLSSGLNGSVGLTVLKSLNRDGRNEEFIRDRSIW